MALSAIMIISSYGLTALASENSGFENVDNYSVMNDYTKSSIRDEIYPDSSQDITVSLDYEPLSNTYTITGGFGKEKRGNIAVGLRIFDENGNLVQTAVTAANRNKNDSVVFVFEPIVFFSNAKSGKYSFEISSFAGSKTIEYEYLNMSDGLALMLKLDNCSGDEYARTIIDECAGTGADIEIFKNLGNKSKNMVTEKLSAVKSGLSAETANDPDCAEKVSTAISNFLKNYNYYTAIGVFNDSTTESQVEAWIKKYAVVYGFKTDNTETAYSESDLWKYYDNSTIANKAHSQLKNIDDAKTMDDIKNKVIEMILCSTLDSAHVSAVDRFLSDYASAFSIDLSSYNSLKNKDTVRAGIVNTGLYSYNAVKSKFESLVSSALSSQNSDKSNGKGGGSGSGNGYGTPASAISGNASTTTQTQTNPFKDLDEADWARDYILKLYGKGIINGKTNDRFAPNDKITRAEIIKIIVEAFGLKATGEKTFADISPNDWYAGFVSAAADNGVAAGDENGNFNPNEFVTRQDIAVMIYRAMKISVLTENTGFTDYEDIADYAKPAVRYFSALKVINGYPDGSFKPHGSATRAEAAKIISLITD